MCFSLHEKQFFDIIPSKHMRRNLFIWILHKQKERHIKSKNKHCPLKEYKNVNCLSHEKLSKTKTTTKGKKGKSKSPLIHHPSTISIYCGHAMLYLVIYKPCFDITLTWEIWGNYCTYKFFARFTSFPYNLRIYPLPILCLSFSYPLHSMVLTM